ncbi:MAG: integrase core domain-containing protein [Dyella sp.]|uniref:integrase core domain-containing protein n=1 Tax=Dyella sp. TaxID=1869338 RepID=UPI003F7E5EAF
MERRFNGTFRTEVLDRYVFTSLDEVRRMTEEWRHRHDRQRPHRSLGGLSPVAYAMASSTTSTSG